MKNNLLVLHTMQAVGEPYTLLHGDVIEQLSGLPDNSVDSLVTDPPYELGFMGKSWDSTGIAYSVPMWSECFRVLKPGGHLLSFGGSRTYHRMASAIEDAGFQIRDQIMWVYGSGFPKSMDVSKAIDKASGAERKVIGFDPVAAKRSVAIDTNAYGDYKGQTGDVTAPETLEARQWEGWGTALKPAHEPIVLARKPLIGTVVANVLEHGTGALNIGASRIPGEAVPINKLEKWSGFGEEKCPEYTATVNDAGRWPANFVHDGLDEVWAKFFYCAKANKRDRNEGCEHLEAKSAGGATDRKDGSAGLNSPRAGAGRTSGALNHHPTVKPTDLMGYLVKMITPPGGTVLDPFMGSGSTGKAAVKLGFKFIGIDREEEYVKISEARILKAIA